MFNIGGSEMILIGIMALIFIPPEKLPGLATQLGRFFGQLNRNFNEIKSQVEGGIKTEIHSIKKALPSINQEIDNSSNNATNSPTDTSQPPR